jgi:hypothetical protein
MTTTTNETAIERLRSSKAYYLARIEERGRADGRAFAMQRATYECLAKLATVDIDEAPENETGGRGELAHWVCQQIDVEIERLFGDELPLDDYAEAFFQGAAEYFEEVKDEL